MKKIYIILFLLTSLSIFASEDKIIVKSYLVLRNSNISIEKDSESLLLEYQKKGYRLLMMDMAASKNWIYVSYHFYKD
ncbi:Caspase family protein [Fusobacterium necrophorum subsp. funduliforme]|uniref:hypothetical protein n=1 Tax=Fusobacterium necrophorum TaxID=859 RepID=UPI0007879586|nr:hypothetical protein [Fusobacterium necrophorum]AYV94347.1 hypothetical protein BWX37_01405 [Fusobacterium necrophorum subsp. funduliforme]KYL04304.1 hypothetical protein A2J06_01480 [Fusobacterium necrophorum subsp. funduliforme]KYM51139.1 hypothetical protein A2U04_01995 [Fusobacterium necrophorum subsp. funduliforme]MDK4472396.1 hypothetical protein [Fusobacterium necrophorum]MDK4479173.1 hypothetical protein [Fusobacterium necrophorum]